MAIEVGKVEAIFRYPVKSMAGEPLTTGKLGWHGLEGDRRLALRRLGDRSLFPWLTASKLPELLLFSPLHNGGDTSDLPRHVRTPAGLELPIFGDELASEIGRRYGNSVEMTQLKHGIFDEANISLIASDTVEGVARLAERHLDVRRFRPNILIRTTYGVPFQEDRWVGGLLSIGPEDDAPTIAVTMRDGRCSMLSLNPDSARAEPDVLKAVVRANDNNAGVYGTVTRTGRISVGQSILFRHVN